MFKNSKDQELTYYHQSSFKKQNEFDLQKILCTKDMNSYQSQYNKLIQNVEDSENSRRQNQIDKYSKQSSQIINKKTVNDNCNAITISQYDSLDSRKMVQNDLNEADENSVLSNIFNQKSNVLISKKSVTASNISQNKNQNGEIYSAYEQKTVSYTQNDNEDSFSKIEYKRYNEVYVWGQNQFGQLGLQNQPDLNSFDIDGFSSKSNSHFFNIPKACCFNVIVQKASCGISHTILLSQSGHLYSMGSNQYGQLGINQQVSISENDQASIKCQPSLIEELIDFFIEDVASGNDHVLAISEDGNDLFSWGQGKFGALGLSSKQNQIKPQKIELKSNQQVWQISAGSRHSAFILKNEHSLHMFGMGNNGQLGLGENFNDKVYKPLKVDLNGQKAIKAALGDKHSLIITDKGHLMSSGANDKYQLGLNMEKKCLNIFNFQRIIQFKVNDNKDSQASCQDIKFKDISCWNLNAAIDSKDGVYIWGILHDKEVKQSLCIKVPEKVSQFKAREVTVGPTMAIMVEKKKGLSFVIGINQQGELGLGDRNQRKTFCIQESLKEIKIKNVAIGKSGYVIAVSENIKNVEDVVSESRSNVQDEFSIDQPENRHIFENKSIQCDKNLFSFQDQRQFDSQQLLITQKQIIDIKNQIQDLKISNNYSIQIEKLEGKLSQKEKIISEGCQQQLFLQQKIKELENKIECQNSKMAQYQKNSIEIQCNRQNSEALINSQKFIAQKSNQSEKSFIDKFDDKQSHKTEFLSKDQIQSQICLQQSVHSKQKIQESNSQSDKQKNSILASNQIIKNLQNSIQSQKLEKNNLEILSSQTHIEQIQSEKSESKKLSKSQQPNEKSYQSNYLRNKKDSPIEQFSQFDIKEGQHYPTLRSKPKSISIQSKILNSSCENKNDTQMNPTSQFFVEKLQEIECLNQWIDKTQIINDKQDFFINQNVDQVQPSDENKQVTPEVSERSESLTEIFEKMKNRNQKFSLKQIEKIQMQFFIQDKIIEDFNKRLYERVDQVQEKDKQLKELGQQFDNLKSKFELENTVRLSIEIENGNNQILIQDLKSKILNVKQKNIEWEEQVSNQNQLIFELQSNKLKLEQENQQKDEIAENLEFQIQKLQEQNCQLNEQISKFETDIQNMKQNFDEEKDQMSKYHQSQCEDYQNQIQIMKEERIQIKQEIIKNNQKVENEFKNQISKKKKQILKLSQVIKQKQENHKAELKTQQEIIQKLQKEIEERKKYDMKNQRQTSPKPYYESLIGPNGSLDNTQNQKQINKNKNALPLRPSVNDSESILEIKIKVDDSKNQIPQFNQISNQQSGNFNIEQSKRDLKDITILEMINQQTQSKNKQSLTSQEIQNFLNLNIPIIQPNLNQKQFSDISPIDFQKTQLFNESVSSNLNTNQNQQKLISPLSSAKKSGSFLQKMIKRPQEESFQKQEFKILRTNLSLVNDQPWSYQNSQLKESLIQFKTSQQQSINFDNALKPFEKLNENQFSNQKINFDDSISVVDVQQKSIQQKHNFISNFAQKKFNLQKKESSNQRQSKSNPFDSQIQLKQEQQDIKKPSFQRNLFNPLIQDKQFENSRTLNEFPSVKNNQKDIYSNTFDNIYEKQSYYNSQINKIKYQSMDLKGKTQDQGFQNFNRDNLKAYSISSNSHTSPAQHQSSPNFTQKSLGFKNQENQENSKFILQKIQQSDISFKNMN